MPKFYSFIIPSAENQPAELYIFGDIEDVQYVSADTSPSSIVRDLTACESAEIRVHINSYGGSTAAGMAIYNTLMSHPARITTIADGFVCSAASLIYMAGDERIMRDSSLLMIHNAWTCTSGNAAELRKAADDLETISATAARIYAERSTLSAEEIQPLLDNETWITPEDALTYGFATEIRTDNKSGPQSSVIRSIREALVSNSDTGTEPPKPAKTPFQRVFGNFR